MDDVESNLIFGILQHAPLLLACLAGVVLGLVFFRRQPLVAGLVVAGSLLFLAGQGVFLYWEYVCIPQLAEIPEGIDALVIYGVPYAEALGVILMLIAAFLGRREERRVERYFDEE